MFCLRHSRRPVRRRRRPRLAAAIGALALLLLLACLPAPAGRGDLEIGFDDGKGEDDTAALLGEKAAQDFALLKASHLSHLSGWDGVQRRAPPRQEAKPAAAAACHWKELGDGSVSPLDDGAMATLIAVPEDGSYRVSLRLQLDPRLPLPVTLTLTPQAGAKGRGTAAPASEAPAFTDAGPPLEHVFGKVTLAADISGRELEARAPVRFERETQRIAIPSEPLMAWEHWDVDLKKGVYRAALATAEKRVRAQALFLSRSRDFRPSLGTLKQDPALGRIHMRFRVTGKDEGKGTKATVTAHLTYHWRGRMIPNAPPGADATAWGWGIGKAPATPAGEWSPFIDATDAIVPGAGPWSTCNLSVAGVRDGELEVQFAWYPTEAAVPLTVKTGLGEGRAQMRVPNGDWMIAPRPGVPAWGLWNERPFTQLLTQEAVIERYFTWADEAAARLALKPDHPRVKQIRLFTGCAVLPPHRARAAEMLARLGINWIGGAPPEIVRKFGLYDEAVAYNTADADGLARGKSEAERARLTKVKIGDEIGTYTAPAAINADPSRLTAFHAYLREQARLAGMDMSAFLGVPDLADMLCLGELPPNPGRFERRLFYHSQRFCHLTTCDGYAGPTRAFERNFPNVRVYNNYSPHPVFLTGSTMNGSDWFVLPRNRAQTLGWAEDWAYHGGWSLGTAWECTSFYAALVDCAVRRHGYPAGFYVGSNCGGSAQKIFGCVAMGVTWLELYSWGPLDAWAEGSNAWSDSQPEYYSILCATAALGPADTIIGQGRREPRRTAILYNRSHEILQGGLGRLNHDWMWTFIALKHSQVPVEVIIEEDLTPEDLSRYDCLFVGGYNLAQPHLAELQRWVAAGGLLIGTSGAAFRDIYDDPSPVAAELFGARPVMAGTDRAASLKQVESAASDWFPAATWNVAGDLRFILEPATARPLARYAGGECAVTANAVGKGHALLMGVQPGYLFRDNGQSRTGTVRQWLAAPVLKRLGRQRLEYDYAWSEATLFEHDTGLAVMLATFGHGEWAAPVGGSRLSVQTARKITEVRSALRGPLPWQREGDRIVVTVPPPAPVDVILLR